MDSPSFLSHIFPQIHLALTYEPFSDRALASGNLGPIGITTGLGITMVGAFVGLQAQSGDYGNVYSLFYGRRGRRFRYSDLFKHFEREC